MNRISRDEAMMQMTITLSKRSVCKRKQVGAMIVRDGRPISVGYNGPVSGQPHCTECSGSSCTVSVHAEMNAIAFAAKEGVKIDKADLYCTLSPCINCAKILANSGILRVYYLEEYRDLEGIEFLKRAGVETTHIEFNFPSTPNDLAMPTVTGDIYKTPKKCSTCRYHFLNKELIPCSNCIGYNHWTDDDRYCVDCIHHSETDHYPKVCQSCFRNSMWRKKDGEV